MDELMKLDSTFSLSTFLTKVDNVFVMLCTSVMTNDLRRVSHLISQDVYNQYEKLLDSLNNNNLTQMYDELNVKSTEVVDVNITDIEYKITVRLITRYMDYRIDKTTGKFVNGNNTSRTEKEKIMVFTKKVGSTGSKRECPYCGSLLDINNTGVCPYCRKVLSQESYDWILTSIN